ncbi:hypothetical protein [Enterococcus sp. UD-01]
MVNKLNRKQLNYSKETIITNSQYFAGLRVICSYSDDIYDALKRHRIFKF